MSRIIVAGRRTGKTLRCITESAKTSNTILVLNDQRKKYVVDLAKSLNLVISEPMTLREWERAIGSERRDIARSSNPSTGLIVDEGLHCLEYLLGSRISMITMSEEEEK